MGNVAWARSVFSVGLVASIAVGLMAGCAQEPFPETAPDRTGSRLDDELLTHEQAVAEQQELERVAIEGVPIGWSPEHFNFYRPQCIVGNSAQPGAARDNYDLHGPGVSNPREVARALVEEVKRHGYRFESEMPTPDFDFAWVSFRGEGGSFVEVYLLEDHSAIGSNSRCYAYDWPELTPTPTPAPEQEAPDGQGADSTPST